MVDDEGNGLETKENKIATVTMLRKMVKFYNEYNCKESALFWAEKLVMWSNYNPRDVYWLAQSMYRCGEFSRAVFLIKNKGLDKNQPLFQWLAGLCLLEAKNYNEALSLLTQDCEHLPTKPASFTASATLVNSPPITNNHILEGFTPESLRSALLALKGRIYEKLGNRSFAEECFKQALKYDVFRYDAFRSLVQHQMLTASEEKELMASLPFKSQCSASDILPSVYEEHLNKYKHFSFPESGSNSSKQLPRITGNSEFREAQAEKLFYACAYSQCHSITKDILNNDPFHKHTLPIHISCLVELKKTNDLFYLAHNLVDLASDNAVSWYAVGCYYFLNASYATARKYLSKAVYLDRYFGPAWLLYGHSFVEENEHDQAMGVYFSAAKLMKGCHLPLLYAGAQCGLINDGKVAEKFLTQALLIAPNDPFVLHELGTAAYQIGDYSTAEKRFLSAMDQLQKTNDQVMVGLAEKWEPLLNNLGHTFRKQKNYTEALIYYRRALAILPQNPSTLASIGFVQALQGNFVEAIDMFHKALSLRLNDSFCITMLSYLIEQTVNVTPTFHILTGDEEE